MTLGRPAAMAATGQLYLWTAWWSFAAASATLLVVSLLTARKTEDAASLRQRLDLERRL